MKLTFNKHVALRYTSASQRIRVLTEHWAHQSIFCPNCGQVSINKYPNNQPVADFYCSNCREEYELKSKQHALGTKIVDGAYRTMVERLESNNNPNFFLLNYDLQDLAVSNFLVIPKHFFVPQIIEKRKPLTAGTQRAGWAGCNILLQSTPETGKIFFVKNRKVEPKEKVLAEWRKTLFLREEQKIEARGWLLDVMRCVDVFGKREFTLDDVYFFEHELSKLHPDNKHIKDKIRQQLQVLRDRGYLKFVHRGRYQLT